MIVWLASYPQSGSNFVRSLLTSYIFTKDGTFDFDLLKNIDLFPNNSLFKQLGVNINNEDEMYENYINSQKIINKKDSIRFLKTHSCFINNDRFKFTDTSKQFLKYYDGHIKNLRENKVEESERKHLLESFIKYNDQQDKFRGKTTWRKLIPELETSITKYLSQS